MSKGSPQKTREGAGHWAGKRNVFIQVGKFYVVLWQTTFRNQTTNYTSVLMDGYYGKSDNWHLGMLQTAQKHQVDLHHPLHHSRPFRGVKRQPEEPRTIYKKN